MKLFQFQVDNCADRVSGTPKQFVELTEQIREPKQEYEQKEF